MKTLRKVMPMLSAALLFIACSKEAGPGTEPGGSTPDGETVETTFDLAVSRLSSATSLPASTGMTAEQENAVNNVWVLQFISGDMVLHEYYDKFTPVSSTAKKVSVALKPGISTVYFVANVGADYFASMESATLAAFEADVFDFSDWMGTSATGLPMVGSFTGSTTTPPAEAVKLTRMVSRIEFQCTLDLPTDVTTLPSGNKLPSPELKLSRVQITNAANNVRYKAHALTGSTLKVCPTFPANANDSDLADNYMHYAEDTSVAGKTTFTIVWYVPENLKGAITLSSADSSLSPEEQEKQWQKEKNPKNAPAGSTCIELSGDYIETTYTKDDKDNEVLFESIKDVTYCIYPGQNGTTDFNLIRNYSYTIKTTIKGIDETDTRVIVEKGIPAGSYLDGEWE
ncbi:MAG: hypothetical protein NC250_09795 [Alistipes senegalensis]|nr:hypothetical protein [Bacteroides cellulosilyticus]MCM1353005.1 hypothetical protein [Alistipes senegalensis]